MDVDYRCRDPVPTERKRYLDCKISHHTAMHSEAIARSLKLLETPDCVDQWQVDLATRHESGRTLIPLATLMADGPR